MRIDEKQQPCKCDAKDQEGNKIEHAGYRHGKCLKRLDFGYQKGEKLCILLITCNGVVNYMLVFVLKSSISQAALKFSWASLARRNDPYANAVLSTVPDAVDRYNKITFEGGKLFTYH